jgi:hypothetical protein
MEKPAAVNKVLHLHNQALYNLWYYIRLFKHQPNGGRFVMKLFPYFMCLLSILSSPFFCSEISFNRRIMNENELKTDNRFMLVSEEELARLKIPEKPQTKSSFFTELQWNFLLKPKGLELKLQGRVSFGTESLNLLPSSWIILQAGKELPLFTENGLYKLKGTGETTFSINAFYPVKENSNHWNVRIPFINQTIGEATFTGTKEFSSVQLRLQTNGSQTLRNISPETEPEFAFSGVEAMILTAHLPLQTEPGITDKPEPDKPEVIKSSRPLVFVISNHEFELKRKTSLYKMEATIRISRNPIRKLELKLPPRFQLKELQTPQPHNRRMDKNRLVLDFFRDVHNELTLKISGEYNLTEETATHHILESAPVSFENVEEERGFLAFYTNDIVTIREVGFKNPDLLNRIDATELPREIISGKETPILWAYRYYEPGVSFSLDTVSFEPYPLKNMLISAFRGSTALESDFSSLNRWSFTIESEEKQNFIIPLPENIRLRTCKINNREVPTYQDQEGNYTVEVSPSRLQRSMNRQQISFSSNMQQLSSLSGVGLEVEFVREKPEGQQLRIDLPLPKETQDIRYEIILPAGQKSPRIKTNFARQIPPRYASASLVPYYYGRLNNLLFNILPNFKTLMYILLALLFFLLYSFESDIFTGLLIPLHNHERIRAFIKLLIVVFGLSFLWVFAFSRPLIPDFPAPAENSAFRGDFYPSMSKTLAPPADFARPSNNFYAPQGLEQGHFIEMDFKNPHMVLPSILGYLLLFVVAIAIYAALLKNRITALGIIAASFVFFHFLELNRHTNMHPLAVLLIPPLALFALGLLMEGIKLKKIFLCSLFCLLPFNAYCREIDLFELETAKGSLLFMEKPVYESFFPDTRKEEQLSPFLRFRLNFTHIENRLYLNADLFCSRPLLKDEKFVLPVFSRNFLLQDIKSNTKRELQFQILDDQIHFTVPEDKITSLTFSYIVHGDFPANLQLPFKTAAVPIHELIFPELPGWRLHTGNTLLHEQENTEQKMFFLPPETDINLQYERIRSSTPEPEIKESPGTRILEQERLKVKAIHNIFLEENFLSGKSQLSLQKQGSPLRDYFINLPEKLRIKGLSSTPKVADWFVDETKNILVLKFISPVKDELEVQLDIEMRLEDKQGKLGCFFMENADHFENHLNFTANDNLSFEIRPNPFMLSSLRGDEYKNNPVNPTYVQVLKKGVSPANQHLQITIIPRQVIQSVSAFIDSLKVVSFLQADNHLYSRYQFNIRNNGQQFLRLNLHEKEQILTAKINGGRVFLGQEKGEIQVPMKMLFDENNDIQPFLFEFTSVRKVENKEELDIFTPGSSLSAASVIYQLSLYDNFRLIKSEGNLVHDKNPTEFRFLSTEKQALLSLGNDAPVDLPVFTNPDAKHFHSHFLSEKEQASASLKLERRKPKRTICFLSFLLGFGLSAAGLFWFRLLLKARYIFALIFFLLIAEQFLAFEVFFFCTGMLVFLLWLPVLTFLTGSLKLREMVEKNR